MVTTASLLDALDASEPEPPLSVQDDADSLSGTRASSMGWPHG